MHVILERKCSILMEFPEKCSFLNNLSNQVEKTNMKGKKNILSTKEHRSGHPSPWLATPPSQQIHLYTWVDRSNCGKVPYSRTRTNNLLFKNPALIR